MIRLTSKILLISGFFALCLCLVSYGQSDNQIPVDEEFNIFLFSILILFIGAMLGTAVITALLLLLFIVVTVSLISFGILSTSLFIGLYKRSFSAGFKTLIYTVLVTGCSILDITGLFLYRLFFDASIGIEILLLTGLGSGLATGFLLGLITVKSIGWIGKWMVQRLTKNGKE